MAETKQAKKAADPAPAKSERDRLIDLLQQQGVIVDKRWDDDRLRQEYAALTGEGQQDSAADTDADPAHPGDVDLAAMEEGVEREGAHRAVCLRNGLHVAPADLADPGMSTRSRKFKSGDVIYFNNPKAPAALQAQGLVKVI